MAVLTPSLVLCDKPVDPEDGTEVIEEEPNGPIDFSTAERQPDGSMCVTKTKYVQKMEKTQVKECWHQNVTACHETYVTEFRPNQERECEENFWKACKISFRERSFNYTLRTCMTPLVKKCDEETSYGNYRQPKARLIVFHEVCAYKYYLPMFFTLNMQEGA